ncbi:hypothetical protein G6F22_017629 [Rhizopus arrhizus]|nr:hypothetical protein G6F22_017629 [Rhizopus arrhizus]
MLRAERLQHAFAVVQPVLLHVDDGLQHHGAFGVRVQFHQPFGGADHFVDETVVQRLDDQARQPVGIVPVLFDGAGQHVLAPLLAGDEHFAALGVVGADHLVTVGMGTHALDPSEKLRRRRRAHSV